MEYRLVKQLKDRSELRESFFSLAEKVFDIHLDRWYQRGYWTKRYVPYAIVHGNRVVANASVNRMDMIWEGRERRYIQLGTVMTDEEYRGRGFARRLLREILDDWKDQCDGVFLFANDTVLDFYPRFGFHREQEYQHVLELSGTGESDSFRKLDMDDAEDRELMKAFCGKSNPYSRLSMSDDGGLVMFYCDSLLRDCIYYCRKYEAVVVGMAGGSDFTCFDIFCEEKRAELGELISCMMPAGADRAILGFTPAEEEECSCLPIEDEDYLFVLDGKENPFSESRLMFPLLSHA